MLLPSHPPIACCILCTTLLIHAGNSVFGCAGATETMRTGLVLTCISKRIELPWSQEVGIMVEVTVEDRATLESWIRATTTEQRLVLRARIILALARGRTNREVAEELSIRPATVSKWRTRFATKGIGGLADAPRSGKPPTYTEEAERRVLSQLDEDPPPGYARWNGPLLAQVLTDVSETQVWRILRRHGISLER